MFSRKTEETVNSEHLEIVSPGDIYFSNTLLSGEANFNVETNNSVFRVVLDTHHTQPEASDLMLMSLLVNGYKIEAVVSLPNLIPWLPPPCNEVMNDAPVDLIRAALQLGFEHLPAILIRFDITDLKIIKFRQYDPEEEEKEIWLSIKVNDSDKLLTIYVKKNEYLLKLIRQLPERKFFKESIIPLNIHFCIGKASLNLLEITDLQTNDIILLSEYFWQKNQAIIFIEEMLYGEAVIQNDQLILTNQELWMSSQIDNTLVSALSKIELEVRFDLGSQRLSLSEILNLQNGYAFSLDRDEYSPVNMVVNGVKIAECQLISVSGKIGAKIVRADTAILNSQIAELKRAISTEQADADPPVLEELMDE